MKRALKYSLSVCAVVAMLATGTTAATASTDAESESSTLKVVQSGESESNTYFVQECVGKLQLLLPELQDQSICKVTTGLELGVPEKVSVDELRNIEGLAPSEKSSLAEAVAAGTVRSNHYSQFTTGLVYTRTQNGTFYYNGSRVWVTHSHLGLSGSHHCFTNYAAGWTIDGTACSEYGSTAIRNMYSAWKASPPFIPFSYDVSMTASLHRNGTISGNGTSVGW